MPILGIDPEGAALFNCISAGFGAFFGTVVNVAAEIASKAITGDLDFTDWGTYADIGIAAATGALAGGLAGFGLGPAGWAMGTAVVSGGSDAAKQGIAMARGEQSRFDPIRFGMSAGIGAIAGAAGGYAAQKAGNRLAYYMANKNQGVFIIDKLGRIVPPGWIAKLGMTWQVTAARFGSSGLTKFAFGVSGGVGKYYAREAYGGGK